MKKFIAFYRRCRKSDSNVFWVLARYVYFRLFYGKRFLLHQRVSLRGIKNIQVNGKMEVGIDYIGFMHRTDKTYLNIGGQLKISGDCYIRRGSRFDIGSEATVSFGKGVLINCNTKLIVMNSLTVGNGSVVSWDCHILDYDFHKISYEGRKPVGNAIHIGDHVWIGSGCKIYKGSVIPDGCVVASDSVVKGVFSKKNALIGGSPAKVLKHNITWS
jgi:acetyltransferase-like isoleucine patch superfamily enzyme